MRLLEKLKDEDCKNFVSHYTSAEVAVNHILPSKSIRFNPLRNTNDPRENKERAITLTSYSLDAEENFKKLGSSVRKKAPALVLDYSKVACFTQSFHENQKNLNTKKTFGRPRMWAQYGENHKGVNFLFDKKKLIKTIQEQFNEVSKEIFFNPVNYDDYFKSVSRSANYINAEQVLEDGLEKTLVKHIIQFKDAFYFRKDSDWQGEDEWRSVILKWDKGYEYVNIQESLIAIILGVDFPKSEISSISKLAKQINAKTFKLSWCVFDEDFEIQDVDKST